MKKNLRVIQINGLRGLCVAIGIVSCLIAGFGAFPGLVMMKAWNLVASYVQIPSISFVQGLLLWGISVVSYMIFTKKRALIAFRSSEELSKEEMEEVMQKIHYETTRQRMTEIINKAMQENSLNEDKHSEDMNMKSENSLQNISGEEKQKLEN